MVDCKDEVTLAGTEIKRLLKTITNGNDNAMNYGC